jgi:hypothetical protein
MNSELFFDESDDFDAEENSCAAEHNIQFLNSQSNNSSIPTMGLEFDSF